jgi:hypothetical protein
MIGIPKKKKKKKKSCSFRHDHILTTISALDLNFLIGLIDIKMWIYLGINTWSSCPISCLWPQVVSFSNIHLQNVCNMECLSVAAIKRT